MWDHLPIADELLQTRLSLGWRPTPSLLKSGEEILGYAACTRQSNNNLLG